MGKRKIIQDKKRRGEWVEMRFIARAAEEGLPVSKPWGDSQSYDCVVGSPRKFAAVQVKSTVAELRNGEGYSCSTCSSHKAYRPGAFDFLAAYVIPEDAWYIIPTKEIRGKKSISLCTKGNEAKYEKYREAWHLLRKACEVSEEAQSGEEQSDGEESKQEQASAEESAAPGAGIHPAKAGQGVEWIANIVRIATDRGRVRSGKEDDRS